MRTIKDTKLNIIGEEYTTFSEMYKINEERSLNELHSTDYDAKKNREVKDGIRYSWEETKTDIMNGSNVFDEDFKAVKAEINKEFEKISANIQRTATKHDVVGQSVCVERALAGHPKAFNRRKPVIRKQKTVHLMFSISCRWSTSTKDRLRCGCIIMAITELLEKSGYQVKVTLFPDFSTNNGKKFALSQVTIKDYKTRFNQKKMQFPVASESVLFQLGCWAQHRIPESPDFGSGEGQAVDTNHLSTAKRYAKNNGGVFIGTEMIVHNLDCSLQKTFDYILDEMKQL